AFKARYSKTLYQYYGEYQMRQAQYMLATNDHSIKYVAYVFGYSNPSKFSAAFKKVTGVLPSEFKASLTTLK
ncbi:MAG: AraC family transcriptional regulator, partial [Bacteroidota bacterium]